MVVWFFYNRRKNFWEASRIIEELTHTCEFSAFDLTQLLWTFRWDVKEEPGVAYAYSIGGLRTEVSEILKRLIERGAKIVNKINTYGVLYTKSYVYNVLSKNKIKIPKSVKILDPRNYKKISEVLDFPIVAKHDLLHRGKGVRLIKNEKELRDFVKKNYRIINMIIFQEFIEYEHDLRIIVVGDKVIGAMERIPPEEKFLANISQGAVGKKFDINEKLEKIAIKSCKSLDIDIGGVDILISRDNGYFVIEVNKEMQFRGFERYTNINVAREIANYLCSLDR